MLLFQKWTEKKVESNVTDTTLEELTSEMKGKHPWIPLLPISFPVPQLLIDLLW